FDNRLPRIRKARNLVCEQADGLEDAIRMVRAGCANPCRHKPSIHRSTPTACKRNRTKMRCASIPARIRSSLPPSLAFVVNESLGPCRRRWKFVFFASSPRSLRRAGWSTRLQDRWAHKEILAPHRRRPAPPPYQIHKICDVESGWMRAPSSFPKLARRRPSTSLLAKGTFRRLRPSSRGRVRVFARRGRCRKARLGRREESYGFTVCPRRFYHWFSPK
ncbi:hypothetical protein C8R44DRAFT_762397, partial [Mycena epipterygia]